MNKSRRIGAVVAMATVTIGMTSASAVAPANADARGPEPVSTWLRPVRAHTDTWIDIHWRTRQRACDASVKYYSRDVDIDYRGNRRSATFSRGVTLSPRRGDYTTIQVNPDMDRGGMAKLRAVITYDSCGRWARSETRSFTLTLPVQRNYRPGRPGDDDRPGRPGNDDRPGNNDWPGNNDRPASSNRPSPSVSPTVATPTASPPVTATATPTASPTTTPPVATPATSPTLPPPAQQGGAGQHGHRGNR